MKLKVVIESSDEGSYTAYVPSLPGCISEGDTREQTISNIREAIVCQPASAVLNYRNWQPFGVKRHNG